MSDTPGPEGEPTSSFEATSTEAEQPAPDPPRRSRARLWLVAAVVLALVLASGAFAAYRVLVARGPQPAQALPASTVAMISLDADPPGSQKLEALKTLHKFPHADRKARVNANTDLVKRFFDATIAKSCPKVDYARDVKPWAGQRIALAAVQLTPGKATPALVIAVTDADAARAGLARLVACDTSSSPSGFAVGDHFAIVSDSTAHARAVLDAGRRQSLEDDPGYQHWTQAAGGEGIVTGYVSRAAASVLRDEVRAQLDAADPATRQQVDRALTGFRGAGLDVSFVGGALQLQTVASGLQQGSSSTGGTPVSALPSDTVLAMAGTVDPKALSQGVGSGLARSLGSGLVGGALSAGSDPTQQVLDTTGLRLPEDLVTLLGKSFSLSLGARAPADLAAIKSPADLDLGFLSRGDDQQTSQVVHRVEQHLGGHLSDAGVVFDTAAGKSVFASNAGYARALLQDGRLGDQSAFTGVVEHVDRAGFVLYLAPDRAWLDALERAASESHDSSAGDVVTDLRAVKALGLSAWSEGGTSHLTVRLTTR